MANATHSKTRRPGRKNIRDAMKGTMRLDVIDPSTAPHRYAKLNSLDYHYLYFEPEGGKWRGSIFLFHGWPDLSMAWRYQIPVLLRLGLRVICPDLPGFGRTEVPKDLAGYSYKSISFAMKELAAQLGVKQIILGGHDWGAALVYRIALWQPQLVTHIFCVCVPYTPPKSTYISVKELAARLPSYTYMLQNASGEVERAVMNTIQIKQFLSGMFGGRGPQRENIFVPDKGFMLEHLDKMGPPPLLTSKELDYYVAEYSRNGLGSACTWYRTSHINYLDDQALLPVSAPSLHVPTLMITATYDDAVKPAYSARMHQDVEFLTMREVPAGHWALWEAAGEVNALVKEWVEEVVFGEAKVLRPAVRTGAAKEEKKAKL